MPVPVPLYPSGRDFRNLNYNPLIQWEKGSAGVNVLCSVSPPGGAVTPYVNNSFANYKSMVTYVT